MSQERDRENSPSSNHQDYLIKLRGIPYSTTKDDIKKFLRPCRVVNVHLFSNNGQTTNECLVDLDSEGDIKTALKKDRGYMGKRYIEVFRSSSSEYKFFLKNKGTISWREPVIRLRGLPSTCTLRNIQDFFPRVKIASNGIYISRDMSDDASGEGFVALVDMENAYQAMDLYDQGYLEDSCIELFPSKYEEAKKTIVRDGFLNGKRFADENIEDEEKIEENPTDDQQRSPPRVQKRSRSSRSRSPVRRSSPKANQNGEYVLKMRGMPFTIEEKDIIQFFPSSCRPKRIEILYSREKKRPNGDATVFFTTRDQAIEAMKYDRKYIGNRYVELSYETGDRRASSKMTRNSYGRRSYSRDS